MSDLKEVNIVIKGGTVPTVLCPHCNADVAVTGEPAINPRTEIYFLTCVCGQPITVCFRK